MKVILSTRNKSKVEQIGAMLGGIGVQVVSLSEAGIEGEAVEDGKTLEENATKKALFALEKTGEWSIADDTGVFIDVFDGEPGIRAARWAGEDASTNETMNFVLEKLKGVPLEKRGTTFRTVAVVISPEGEKYVFEGSVHGVLLEEPQAECQPNMPYSALFRPEGHEKVWAQMGVEEENKISHRGKAFRQVCDFFKELVN